MRNLLVLVSCLAAACASSRPIVAAHQPTDDTGHLEAAADQRGESYQCGDTVMSDQSTSGGQRLVQAVPCWDTREESTARHEEAAAREEQLASAERREAAGMAEAELAACRGLSKHDREHSPLAHRRAIAEVIPHREAGKVRGVRVVLKPVPGLTATWMRKAIGCHRARFERLGEPATYLSDDPTLVAGATATVELRRGHVEVMIEAADEVGGAVAVARARELVSPRTARK